MTEEKDLNAVISCLREMRQKLTIFKQQYSLSTEAYKLLNAKIEQISKKLAKVQRLPNGKIDPASLQPVLAYICDCKDWLSAFAEGYELADEALNTLYQHYDVLAQKLEP